MASLSIPRGRNPDLRSAIDRPHLSFPSNQIAQFHLRHHRSPSISMQTANQSQRKISTAINSSYLCSPFIDDTGSYGGATFGDDANSEIIDEWMNDSVAEIVKNLPKAPLLVQVFANNGATRLKTEKAVADDWPIISRKWKGEEIPKPDGVILVEELRDGDDLDGGGDCGEESGTKAWGVVVQKKGAECGPDCYLLKTSRVGSGLGSFCTHFCLSRVQSFRKSALSQLTDCWLLG